MLKTDGPLLVSLPHPVFEGTDYFDRTGNRRTVGDLLAAAEAVTEERERQEEAEPQRQRKAVT